MKVHLIKANTIRKFISDHSGSSVSFEEVLSRIKFADWLTPSDIKNTFPDSDLLGRGSSRVVFNISGNRFRMICKYAFGENEVHLFVCWIGTHAAYTKICKEGKQYSIHVY